MVRNVILSVVVSLAMAMPMAASALTFKKGQVLGQTEKSMMAHRRSFVSG